MDITNLTITSFHEGVLKKEFSALEVAQEFFHYIEEYDKDIGAYLSLLKDEAYREAERVDIAVAKNEDIPLLAGVPIAVKDNILISGTQTTAASQILKNYMASFNATVIEKLNAHHAVFLGKTNLDEFAMGSSTENSGFQLTKNPHDREQVPGGSSGGSAAAVAAGEAVAALGSDTGGSIRQPASFCGVVGLKPTYGAVSRHGLIALASSLDQIGPITKTVDDAAVLFDVLRGKDTYDATSSQGSLELWDLERVKRLRIGIPREYIGEGLSDEVVQAMDEVRRDLESLGISVEEISLPHTEYALACYYIIMPAEASANLARYDGIRYNRTVKNPETLRYLYIREKGKRFGAEVKRRILLGTFTLSAGYYEAYYSQAQRVRRLITRDFEDAFQNIDVILTPTAPTTAFKIGEKVDDPLTMYLSDIFTVPANLAGLPALSIPVRPASPGSLPIGFQLIGRRFQEGDILSIGSYYEKINV